MPAPVPPHIDPTTIVMIFSFNPLPVTAAIFLTASSIGRNFPSSSAASAASLEIALICPAPSSIPLLFKKMLFGNQLIY